MKAVMRCILYAALAGGLMNLLDELYHDYRRREIVHSLETSPSANIIQYFPQTFHFYLITNSQVLDVAIIAGLTFCACFAATRLVKKSR
ncbi:hypothetical protein GZH47_19520 [Paenibacillus rhizovicinus]|uniref:Uncharacterized protein n=1 Tax=Paenibacillus rhizovicinus TaxID=2704463 RepID=A0A6C0P2J4_9BACL|nr:hypothetical protein [Paenibacillus rhizovicinus]QHW32780.1 hypothetical protein GZH47_19520 [Paenibacillus rhizovicinus]